MKVTSEVTQAIEGLSKGTNTIEQVENLFKTRNWPADSKQHSTLEDLQKSEVLDSAPDTAGSRSEITNAWFRGLIDDEQYKRLQKASTVGMKSKA